MKEQEQVRDRAIRRWQSAKEAWERGQRSTSHPYLLYRIGPFMQGSHCQQHHLAFDGLLLSRDDPFWKVAHPPNGWRCACHTRFVSRSVFARYQRDGIPYPPGEAPPGKKAAVGDERPNLGKPIKTDRPVLHRAQYRNKDTAQTHMGYEGIEPGFDCHPADGEGNYLSLGDTWEAAE